MRSCMKVEKLTRQYLFVFIRVLFGLAWFGAGVTKITDLHWFSNPGVFLADYLMQSIDRENVPELYSAFLMNVALPNVMTLNYMIPTVQMLCGALIASGLLIIPALIVCLFMHINFILSGNMNIISLTLYTGAFVMLLGKSRLYILSVDRYLWSRRVSAAAPEVGGIETEVVPYVGYGTRAGPPGIVVPD